MSCMTFTKNARQPAALSCLHFYSVQPLLQKRLQSRAWYKCSSIPCVRTSKILAINRRTESAQRAMAAVLSAVCGKIFNLNRTCVHSRPRHRQNVIPSTCVIRMRTKKSSALADDSQCASVSLDEDYVPPVKRP